MNLIQSADVVIENFRPGVMQRLGLGTEEMTASESGAGISLFAGFCLDG